MRVAIRKLAVKRAEDLKLAIAEARLGLTDKGDTSE